MTEGSSLPVLASDAERERAGELLRQASVEGRITLDEFSARIERALAARTRDELEKVTQDLPRVSSGVVAGAARRTVRSSVAIMSAVDRKGFWRVDEESGAIAVMGACKLDLRGAVISAQVTTINAFAFWGSIDVVVPFGVEVDLQGIAIMGTKTLTLKGPPPAPGAPVVRINAVALMGAVTVRDRPSLGERLKEAIEDRLAGG
ncbi:MAG TPA: DUF1707 domain-containing protein [Candidatus Dormibacteraeota bacterium]